jgi:hypothetical protein
MHSDLVGHPRLHTDHTQRRFRRPVWTDHGRSRRGVITFPVTVFRKSGCALKKVEKSAGGGLVCGEWEALWVRPPRKNAHGDIEPS